MKLPEKFEARMKQLLGSEFEAYMETFKEPRYYGIRVNELKISSKEIGIKVPFDLKKVPWCDQGYYYDKDDRPAKNPYYYAGLYYIQEPSAMVPAALIPIKQGDKVLDLCAAPGGKSTQIASRLKNTGVLISNDISATRAKALLKNIENAGAKNAIIINETPERLAQRLQGYFDKILIDAPCSGEGMFRKSPDEIKSWEKYGVEYFCKIQANILENAAKMLTPGGMMIYSTCTFSPEENEGMIGQFLEKHAEFKVEPLAHQGGLDRGRPEWSGVTKTLEGAARLWPHKLKGEGHFTVLLQKNKDAMQENTNMFDSKKTIADFEHAKEFIQKFTKISIHEKVTVIRDKMYLLPNESPDLTGLRVIRSGWLLGELKKNRFEPSQALAMGCYKEDIKNVISFDAEDENVIRYLKGETLLVEAQNGWNLVCVDGYPLGWAKGQNNMLKNKYPQSWRWIG